MNAIRLMDEKEFFLRSSRFMSGMKEALHYGNTVFVSPALFQLLTDEEDMDTIYAIANQFILRKVSLMELMEMINVKNYLDISEEEPGKIVRFQIIKECS